MNERARTPAWLSWLLLAAFAGCLNPHPDDEPLARPNGVVPGTEGNGSGVGSNEGPPLLMGEDDTNSQPQDTPQQTPTAIADAGVPPADAGVTSGDAGSSGVR